MTGHSYDPVSTVRSFYLALSKADGMSATALVVPEKRAAGAYNADSITQFYSGLREPLRVLSIERVNNDTVGVKYRFVRSNGTACVGDAKVNTILLEGKTLIMGISANC